MSTRRARPRGRGSGLPSRITRAENVTAIVSKSQDKLIDVVCDREVEIGETIYREKALFLKLDSVFQRRWPGPQLLGKEMCGEYIRTIAKFMKKVQQMVDGDRATIPPGDEQELLSDYFFRPENVEDDVEEADFSKEYILEVLFGLGPPYKPTREQEEMVFLVKRFLCDALGLVLDKSRGRMFAYGTYSCILNHSCRPNAIAIPQILSSAEGSEVHSGALYIRAIRPLQKGEEVTIAYPRGLDSSRERQRRAIKFDFYFACDCDACASEKLDPKARDLKDVVYGLYAELERYHGMIDDAPAPQLYRKAAVVLDGFDALGIAHLPVRWVYEICAIKAVKVADLLRCHFFLSKVLEWLSTAYGDVPCSDIDNVKEQIRKCRLRMTEIDDKSAFSYSTYQEYDINQDMLEDMMFMMTHGHNDTVYHCLQVVNGKVEEIPAAANDKRIKAMLQKQQEKRAQQQKLQENQHARSIDDTAREIEAMGEPEPKKVSKKGKKRAKKALERAERGEAAAPDGNGDETLPEPGPTCLTDEEPFVCFFAATDGVSKQAWLRDQESKEALRFEPRDVGHLLAAKDGMSTDQERFVLGSRRDSISGRIQGEKEFVELSGRLGRRARAHSFGNDGSKKDLLKEAEVRESKCW